MSFGPLAPFDYATGRTVSPNATRRFLRLEGGDCEYVIYPRAWDRRPSLWPMLRLAIALFLAGAVVGSLLTFAFSAASSSPHTGEGRGTPTPAAVVPDELAAVRATVVARGGSVDGTPRDDRRAVPDDATHSPTVPAATIAHADVLAIITNAFTEWGQDPAAAIAVARCESQLDPNAVGDGGAAVGVFQWHIGPFLAHARQLYGRDVGDLRADPVASSMVAAFTVSRQGWGIWTCGR